MTGWAMQLVSTVLRFRGYRWQNGDVTVLPPLGGTFAGSFGRSIADDGVVAGSTHQGPPSFILVAARWDSGGTINIDPNTTSQINGINDAGIMMVGYQLVAGSNDIARLWELVDGTVVETDLGAYPDNTSSHAVAINQAGQIVGQAFGGIGPDKAILWMENQFGQFVSMDLNLLIPPGSGWNLTSALGINDIGQIVGRGTLNGQPRGFLLTKLVVQTVDPIAELVVGGSVTTDVEELGRLDRGRSVIGIAADGVQQILLRILGLPGPGSVSLDLTDEMSGTNGVGMLRSIGGSEQNLTSLTVNTVELADGRHVAFALLVAPEDFVRQPSDEGDDIREIDVNVQYSPSGQGDVLQGGQTILVRRPPVLLIHGIWSNEFTWEWPALAAPRFIVHREDYRLTNGEEFAVNVVQPRDGVSRARLRMIQEGFAVTQVDVVGHSMGGILTRLYLSEHFGTNGPSYFRNDNFLAGDINRLITLDSPHQGSPLADIVMAIAVDSPIFGDQLETLADKLGTPVDRGAVADLQTDSQIITSLQAAQVPSHAIVATGGTDIVDQAIETIGAIAAVVGFTSAFGAPPLLVFPPPIEHDLLVTRASQEGGLPTGTGVVTVISFTSPSQPAHHMFVTKDDRIAQEVVDLLNTPVGDNATFAPEFPAAGGSPAGSGGLPQYGDIVSGIVISDPLPGTLVNPGEQRSVTVTGIDGFVPAIVLISSSVDTDLVDSPPFSSDIAIPHEAIGEVTLSAIAFDSQWNMAIAQDVVVQVNVSASLTGISLEPDTAFLLSFAADYQMRVFGSYDDGFSRDITSSEFGTAFESLNPAIALVDDAGTVSSVSVGVASIRATNGIHSATAQVFVATVTCPGDVNVDALVDVVDLLALLAAWGTCPDLPNLCPADFNDDSVVDVVDLLLLLGHWGPCS